MKLYLSNKKMFQPSNYHTMNLYLSNKRMSSTTELPYNEPLPFKQKNVFNHRITIQWTFTFQIKKRLQPSNYHTMNLYLSNKKMSSTIELPYNEPLLSNKKMSSTNELPYNEPLPFKQKNVFNKRITIQWTINFQTKKTCSTIELPYNGPLPFKQKNVFNHRITIQWTFTFQTKKSLPPSNYHTTNLYLSNKKTSSTIKLPYNETFPFKRKNVFNHQITIQWTFIFQTKKCLQQTNYHTMNLYLSNKKTISTIELPYNEPLPFKQKNVFNPQITIQWTFTFQKKMSFTIELPYNGPLPFKQKKCLQPSNYHTMNLYLSNKKMSSTIELPYNEPLPFTQENVFNHRITIKWTFTFQTKKCLQQTNYHKMNLYLSKKKTSSTIELPYNEPLPFKRKYVFKHRITIQWTSTFQTKNVFSHRITIKWTFTFQTKKFLQPPNYHTMNLYLSNKKCLQPSNYHTMNPYLSNKNTSSNIELP